MQLARQAFAFGLALGHQAVVGVLQGDVQAIEGVQLHPHPRNELAILRVARLEALLELAFGLA